MKEHYQRQIAILKSGNDTNIQKIVANTNDGLFALYEATTGENEARNVEIRQQMTEEERRLTSPDQTADRPYRQNNSYFQW